MCTEKNKTRSAALRAGFIFVAFASLAGIFYCFSKGISGNDFWWHIKVGEWICTNRTVPTTDIFSWYGTELGISWTAHEWLADVIFYGLYTFAGQAGVFFFCLAAAVGMLLMMYTQVKEYMKENLLIGGLFFALFSVLTSLFFYGRPHLFSYFLLFLELKILYTFMENPSTKTIFLLPIIGCVWSNIHGGSANLAYILCGIFLTVSVIDLKWGRIVSVRLPRKYVLLLAGITALTIGSIFVNPIGMKVFLYPYESFGDTLMMTVISEWQAPDAKSIGNVVLYFLPIFLLALGFVVEERTIKLIDVAVMVAFLYLFFRSSRFIVLWYIAACFCAFKYVPACKVKEFRTKGEAVSVYAGVALLAVMILCCGCKMVRLGGNEGYISEVLSKEAIAAIKKEAPDRLFNDYNIGEALIFNDIPVFFDARADLYAQEHILEDGVSLTFLEQANEDRGTAYVDVDALIAEYQFDGIAILKSRPLYAYLVSDPESYTLIYEDPTLSYFRVIDMQEGTQK